MDKALNTIETLTELFKLLTLETIQKIEEDAPYSQTVDFETGFNCAKAFIGLFLYREILRAAPQKTEQIWDVIDALDAILTLGDNTLLREFELTTANTAAPTEAPQCGEPGCCEDNPAEGIGLQWSDVVGFSADDVPVFKLR